MAGSRGVGSPAHASLNRARRAPRRADYLAYRVGSALAGAAPEPVARLATGALAGAAWAVLRGRRRTLARHLRRAHGADVPAARLRGAVLTAFLSYGRYWVESFRLPRLDAETVEARFEVDGLEHVDAALADGRGLVLCTPHLGGWDFAAAWFARRGYPLTAVVEPLEPPELFAWFVAFRESLGIEVVPVGPQAGAAVLAALKANRAVALVCDRDLAGNGIEVEFFGERTTLPAGPATLALRTGAPLLPVAAYFAGRKGHRATVRPPLAVERRGRFREDAARITQTLARELEVLIRVAPEQWHLLQPNWPSDYDALGVTPPAGPARARSAPREEAG